MQSKFLTAEAVEVALGRTGSAGDVHGAGQGDWKMKV